MVSDQNNIMIFSELRLEKEPVVTTQVLPPISQQRGFALWGPPHYTVASATYCGVVPREVAWRVLPGRFFYLLNFRRCTHMDRTLDRPWHAADVLRVDLVGEQIST